MICLLTLDLVSLVSVTLVSPLHMSDCFSYSEPVGEFDQDGLGVFVTAFERINSGYRFNLRSFCMASSLGVRSFVWNSVISVSLLNFGQFLEKV